MKKLLVMFILCIVLIGCTRPAGLASTHEHCMRQCLSEYCERNIFTNECRDESQFTPILKECVNGLCNCYCEPS